ncbi:MAG: hypothetical protein JWR08_2344 [Enterovirga sp.]|nr:hypothetical protein [Enterovirga sp.]
MRRIARWSKPSLRLERFERNMPGYRRDRPGDMSLATRECVRAGRVDLPPTFSLVRSPEGTGAFAFARRSLGRHEAGTLVWSDNADHLDFAVVLEPDEPLATARRAFFVGMSALVHAIASVAPPDKPLVIDWPDTIRFDGARLGGGRLGWSEDVNENAVPPFLVFGATLVTSKARAGDPGLTPASTSLEEEGFEPGCEVAMLEAFGRHLMRGFDVWREETFEAVCVTYLERLSEPVDGGHLAIDGVGDLVRRGDASARRELVPALLRPAWLDPSTGMPRL